MVLCVEYTSFVFSGERNCSTGLSFLEISVFATPHVRVCNIYMDWHMYFFFRFVFSAFYLVLPSFKVSATLVTHCFGWLALAEASYSHHHVFLGCVNKLVSTAPSRMNLRYTFRYFCVQPIKRETFATSLVKLSFGSINVRRPRKHTTPCSVENNGTALW